MALFGFDDQDWEQMDSVHRAVDSAGHPPRGGLFRSNQQLSGRVDDLLDGFGDS